MKQPIYHNLNELVKTVVDTPTEGISVDSHVAKLIRVYFQAQEEAKVHGCVGVGCITYAEQALIAFQEALAKAPVEVCRERLNGVAQAFMDLRPDLKSEEALSTWLAEHEEAISDDMRDLGYQILDLFPEYS